MKKLEKKEIIEKMFTALDNLMNGIYDELYEVILDEDNENKDDTYETLYREYFK